MGSVGTERSVPLGRDGRSAYAPAVDGMRAVAVLAVVAFHAGVPGVRGGFLGVEVFFGISGYLITSQLLLEREDTGRIALGRFSLRRLLRLAPALYVLLPCAAVLAALRPLPGPNSSVPVLTLAAGLYVMNWWNVLGAPDIGTGYLGHTWSLAIEEQFYLLWPLSLSVALRRLEPRRLAHLLVALVLGLAAVRSVVADHGAATEFLTPFRLDGLLLGAALSLATGGRGVVPAARTALGGMVGGLAAGAVLAAMVLVADPGSRALTRGFGLTGFSALSLAVLVLVLNSPGHPITRVLGAAPLAFLGRLSYGLYLWHYLVDRALTGAIAPGLRRGGLDLLISLPLAAVSYYAVEQPALRLRRRLTSSPRPAVRSH